MPGKGSFLIIAGRKPGISFTYYYCVPDNVEV
jgi:hypothetical protein